MHGGIYRCTGIYFFKSAITFKRSLNFILWEISYFLCCNSIFNT